MEANPNYLLDVDRMLVLPVDTKVRFVITADDVIHSWWVPALGWKQDAIPGIVNEAWADIRTPGIYRGQCAELRSEEHTSELQSLMRISYAVFCLKKKNNTNTH